MSDKLNWESCISESRPGKSASGELHRTHFQRDYDRLIFHLPSGGCKIKPRYFLCRATPLYITD